MTTQRITGWDDDNFRCDGNWNYRSQKIMTLYGEKIKKFDVLVNRRGNRMILALQPLSARKSLPGRPA